jgi:ABC-type antimicrobial peptide transport system ATPase subunit
MIVSLLSTYLLVFDDHEMHIGFFYVAKCLSSETCALIFHLLHHPFLRAIIWQIPDIPKIPGYEFANSVGTVQQQDRSHVLQKIVDHHSR